MRRLTVVIASVVIVGSMAWAGPAEAQIRSAGNFIYVTSSNLSRGGFPSAAVAAVCPAGSRTVSAGGGFKATIADARLSQLSVVDAARTEVQSFNSSTHDLTLSAVAVCLRSPLDASLSVPGSGAVGTFASLVLEPKCPADTTRLGGGAGVTPPAPGRFLVDAMPRTGSYLGAFVGPPVSGTTFVVRAACLAGGLMTEQTISVDGIAPAGGVGSARVRCPRGTQVSGGGVDSVHGIASSRPFDHRRDRDRAPDDGWAGAVFNPGSADAGFTVFAVCARRT